MDTNGIPRAVVLPPPMKNLEKPWYEAAHLGPYNYHPERCEDWNLESMGNTDLGEPLVAPFSGLVLAAANYGGGTGRVCQILGITPSGALIVWGGWHLHSLFVAAGLVVEVGDPIGTIGNADGRYAGAHLHEQICMSSNLPAASPPPPPLPQTTAMPGSSQSRFYLDHGVDPDLIRHVTLMDGQ